MTKPNGAKEKKLTAAQRIEKLEGQLLSASQSFTAMAGDIDTLRQTIAALARRLNATIKTGEKGAISNDLVNELLVEENTVELAEKIDFLKKQGVLVEAEKSEIHDNSFVIGRELDEEKNVINPRIQFALASIHPEVKDLLVGKKVGDVITNNKGDGLLLEVIEILDIAQKVEKKFEEPKQAWKRQSLRYQPS